MTERFRRTLSAQRLFVGGMLLLFVAVSVQYSYKAARGKSAINRWTPQIQQMESGEDIHRQYSYPNPPIMAILLWPISELVTLSPVAGALAWFYIKVAMAMFCVFAVFRLIETPEHPFPAWAKVLTVLLSFRPILGDLTHGNVNIFILFLVVASLSAFTRGRDLLAGVLLALAIACKVTPALFVGYFVWKHAWRVLAGCAVGLVGFFFIVPSAFMGWAHNLQALTSWYEVMILPFLGGGIQTPEHNNQSLPGLISRLLTSAPSFSTFIGGEYVPLRYDNLVAFSPANAAWILKGCMGLFSLLVIWRCRAPIQEEGRTKSETRQGWRLAAEYSLICIGMLLFSERTWKHHCVTLLLPFAVLCYGMAKIDWPQRTRRLIGAATIAATLLTMTTSTGLYGENLSRLQDQADTTSLVVGPAGLLASTQSGIYTDSLAKRAQVYGAYTWGFVLLIAALAVQMRQSQRIRMSPAIPTSGWKLPAFEILYSDRKKSPAESAEAEFSHAEFRSMHDSTKTR